MKKKSQKIWQKTGAAELDKQVEAYTIGQDYLLDMALVPFDIQGSAAHAEMLKKIGVLTQTECSKLLKGLDEILKLWQRGQFALAPNEEDCHSAIEEYLIQHCGEAGEKIHTGRSRNDQILVTLRLYSKENVAALEALLHKLLPAFSEQIKKYGNVPMPGYTHMQKAMPSTVGLWLGSFHDALVDDLVLLKAVAEILDQNPLGSAAGFGENTLGLDREFTTLELGFSKVQQNTLYCALSRGKFENMVLQALSNIMFDLGKMASDLLLFTMSEFDFFGLPDSFTTGSSIMPQKKNFDVLELIRGNTALFHGYQFQAQEIIKNLPSGYNRDFQLTKEPYMKGVQLVKDTVSVFTLVVQNLTVKQKNLAKACTSELYATEQAYELVKKGMSFREAYRKIGKKFIS